MTTAAVPFRRPLRPHAGRTPVPWWMLAAGVLLVACCVPAFWPWESDRALDIGVGACFIGRIAIQAWTQWWASRRSELPRRLRQVLIALAGIGAVSTIVSILEWIDSFGYTILPVWMSVTWAMLAFALLVAAVLMYPLAQRPGGWATLVIDVLISLAGYGTLMLVLVTLPSLRAVPDAARWTVLTGAVTQVLMLVGLNVLVMRGVPIPSRRAFWCLVAGISSYLPMLVLDQLEYAHAVRYGWSASIYFLSVLPMMAAAYFIRTDPLPVAPPARQPDWLADLNPIPLSSPLALSIFLLMAVFAGPPERIVPFGVMLVIASALLVARVILSGRENARLAAEETAAALRQQREKLDAIGLLAGGVAHEFNNAMTVVIGCAELGTRDAAISASVREDFATIQASAGRVVHLTSRLLAFSGRQRMTRVRCDLQAAVLGLVPALRRSLPAGVTLDTDAIAPVHEVLADPEQVAFVVSQLVENAVAAMPAGGTLTIALRMRDAAGPVETASRILPAGPYVELAVRDTGVGMSPETLRRLFEPFFTTRRAYDAAGLGLPAVLGIADAHGGGVVTISAPREGTVVQVLLPAQIPA
ncbi:MAG: hypothetical protein IT355_15110 [Gemmatimonadaceae bacterium]|nr:hypothetical protein [Gemmatimonadaceae bacterium]